MGKKSKNKRNKKSAKKYKGGGGKEDILKMLTDTSPDELVSRADELLSMAHESSPESPSSLKMTINSIDQFPSLPRAVRTPIPKPRTAWGTRNSPRNWGEPEPEPEPEEYVQEPFDSDKYRSALHSKLTEMGDATKKEKQDAVYEYAQKEKKPKLAWLKKQQVTEFTPNFSWLPIEVAARIYKKSHPVAHSDELPTEFTCEQVSDLCGLDPRYCTANKFKEKFHEICLEIKKTNKLIADFNYQLELIQEVIKRIQKEQESPEILKRIKEGKEKFKKYYEIEIGIYKKIYDDKVVNEYSLYGDDDEVDKYIDKMELEKEVKDILKELIDGRLFMDDDRDWYDVVTSFYSETNKKNIDFFKDFMIKFGKKLHQKNKKEYNPIKVEKIKQDIINKYFLRLDELKELYY